MRFRTADEEPRAGLPMNSLLVSFCCRYQILFPKVWDPVTGQCQQTLIGHSSWISCVSITTDCKTIISGSNDKNVKLWNATGNEHARNISTPSDHILHHATQPECVAITTDGHWGLSGSKSDSLKLWDIASAKCVKSSPGSIACIVAMHRSTQVITGSHNGDITVWNCDSLEVQQTVKAHQGSVMSLQISKDDRFIVSASNDKTVGLCQVYEGQTEQLEGHSDAVLCVCLMNEEDLAISGSKDKTVRLWNLQTKSCERIFEGHTGVVGCLASTSDNKTIVSGSGDFTLKIWNTERGECLYTLQGHNDAIKCIGITADDRFAIAGSHEGKDQLLLWNLKDGGCARKFTGHTHAVMHLKVLPNNMMVTSSRDGTIKLWNIQSGELVNSFDFQSQVKYFDAHRADDGYSVILVTKSGTVSILKLRISNKEIEESFSSVKSSTPVNEESSVAKATPSESGCCVSCQCCNCCQNCTVM